MRKVSISLQRGKGHKVVGLAIYKGEDEEELRKVIGLAEDGLRKHFPGVEITKQRAIRELFGEKK